MKTTTLTIKRAFGIIGEIFDELRRGDGVRWGNSIRETIDEAILTYKREMEKMDEKVEKLERMNANHT